jgi:hypothetical protein
MSKEQQELLDNAYNKYQSQTWFHIDDLSSLAELDGMNMSTGERKKVYRQYAPVEFIDKCKTNPEFSEKWGLKIEERELGLDERYHIWFTNNYETGMERYFDPNNIPKFDDPYYEPTPTKLITITYNNKTIESYDTKNNTIFRN